MNHLKKWGTKDRLRTGAIAELTDARPACAGDSRVVPVAWDEKRIISSWVLPYLCLSRACLGKMMVI
jgi:hypothetical protein